MTSKKVAVSGDSSSASVPAALELAVEKQQAATIDTSSASVPAGTDLGHEKHQGGTGETSSALVPAASQRALAKQSRQKPRAVRLQEFVVFVKQNAVRLRARASCQSRFQKYSQKFAHEILDQHASVQEQSWYKFMAQTKFSEAEEKQSHELYDWLVSDSTNANELGAERGPRAPGSSMPATSKSDSQDTKATPFLGFRSKQEKHALQNYEAHAVASGSLRECTMDDVRRSSGGVEAWAAAEFHPPSVAEVDHAPDPE